MSVNIWWATSGTYMKFYHIQDVEDRHTLDNGV